MGNEKMNNLNKENILFDDGDVSVEFIKRLESIFQIKLPCLYVNFITKHNGANLRSRIFDYCGTQSKKNSDSLAFANVVEIEHTIELLTCDEDPDLANFFEDGLIPFGDTGGGDKICFDYRDNKKTDNPQIVFWDHEIGFREGVFFIANNFEEFINMLHEPDDED